MRMTGSHLSRGAGPREALFCHFMQQAQVVDLGLLCGDVAQRRVKGARWVVVSAPLMVNRRL
jgi:hypothetical protein